MKIKEFKNFRDKPLPELEKELQAREEKLAQLRFDLAAGKVKNIREIRHLKKDIAQILTLLSEVSGKGSKAGQDSRQQNAPIR